MASATLGEVLEAGSNRLLDLLMPPACIACKAPTVRANGWCADCLAALPAIEAPACARCGVPLPPRAGGSDTCLGCLADPPGFDAALAPFRYDGPARETVLRFKNGREALARPMARQMLALFEPAAGTPVVPVPLHRWRLLRRGYNQALLLAREVARLSGGDLLDAALVRTRPTPASRGMNRAERARNVAGAFAVDPGQAARLAGREVLLVDDVLTTGATAGACARVLRRAGAARVTALTFARVAAEGVLTYTPPLNG